MSSRFSILEIAPWPIPMASATSSWVCCVALRRSLRVATESMFRISVRGLSASFRLGFLRPELAVAFLAVAFFGFLGMWLAFLLTVARRDALLPALHNAAHDICRQRDMQPEA